MKIQQQKKGRTTTNVEYTIDYINDKLEGQKCENTFYHKHLPINKDTKFDNISNNENFKKTIEMDGIGCKSNCFKSAEVSMIGYVCGASIYPQVYDQIISKSTVV